jgi:hypothetical protein
MGEYCFELRGLRFLDKGVEENDVFALRREGGSANMRSKAGLQLTQGRP